MNRRSSVARPLRPGVSTRSRVSTTSTNAQPAQLGDEDAAHALARDLAARVAGVAVARLQLTHRCPRCGSIRHGVPRVLADGATVPVSVSRAPGAVAAAATDGTAIGIDIEPADAAGFRGFAEVAVHPDEQIPADPAEATRMWVRKEAVLKALGSGLRIDPRSIRLAPDDRPPAVLAWSDRRPPTVVELIDLPAGLGYVAALAVIGGSGAEYTQVSIRAATSIGV